MQQLCKFDSIFLSINQSKFWQKLLYDRCNNNVSTLLLKKILVIYTMGFIVKGHVALWRIDKVSVANSMNKVHINVTKLRHLLHILYYVNLLQLKKVIPILRALPRRTQNWPCSSLYSDFRITTSFNFRALTRF